MPINIALSAMFDGVNSIPFFWPILKTLPWLGLLWLIKVYCSGAMNTSERTMHGKVVLVTGGTSGVGEAVVRDLATRGAQIVLLTQHALTDPFIVDYIDDVRRDTNNQLITAERVDLASLHSVRTFATRWIDNAPPRRLDMLVLCGCSMATSSSGLQSNSEGIEITWQVNYLANFHLLSILSPALRAQPPDRDVRVLIGTCSSYMAGDLVHLTERSSHVANVSEKGKSRKTDSTKNSTAFSPSNAYASSKYALTAFALAFQKHLSSYKRPDSMPMNTKVILVDPGFSRTPGTRRWLSRGSLLGLLLYLIMYPVWWMILKSPDMGAQSFLYAAMEEKFSRADGGLLVKECKERDYLRPDVKDENVQKRLWKYSEELIEEAEKRGAVQRAKTKREAEDKKEEEEAVKEAQDYKQKVGKKDGQRKEGSRRSKKAS